MKYRLGDICTISKGVTGIMKAIPGAYTMVALGEANKTHNQFQFDTKAVIVPLVSSTGHGHASMKRVKYQEGKFALGSILCAVIPKDEKIVLAKYLHIYLHWNREELLVSQMKGMANVSLPMNKIADVIIIVPSIEKQQEIIDLEVQLVEKELLVEKLLADQITQLENLNQAILQAGVQGKLVKQDSKDEPVSELLKRIKAEKAKSGKKVKLLPPIKLEDIPFNIPENWVWCRLDNVITFNLGKTPPSKDSKYWSKNSDGYNWISISDMNKADYLKITSKKVTELAFKNIFNGNIVKKGTLIMSFKLTIGKMSILDIDAFHNEAIINIHPILLERDFVKYVMPIIVKYGNQRTAIKGNTLNREKLEKLLFPLPPLSEQKLIVEEIEKQLAKTKQLKEHIIANQQATEQLLKALLHQAFEVEEMEEV